jgi:hypothetical protein
MSLRKTETGYQGFQGGSRRPVVPIKTGPAARADVQSRVERAHDIYTAKFSTDSVLKGSILLQPSTESVAGRTLAAAAVAPRVPPSKKGTAAPPPRTADDSIPFHAKSVYQDSLADEETLRKAARDKTPPRTRMAARRGGGAQKKTDEVRKLDGVFPSRGAAASTYGREISGLSERRDRLDREGDITKASGSRDLFEGTPKSVGLVPGYMGHIPQAGANLGKLHYGRIHGRSEGDAHIHGSIHGRGEADGSEREREVDRRKEGYRDSLSFTMLHNMPGYTGYVPKSEMNEQKSRGPEPLSTAGSSFVQFAPEHLEGDRSANRKAAVKTFFVGGGVADAEKFFSTHRPLEGLPKVK